MILIETGNKRAAWAEKIRSGWRASVESIIHIGDLLAKARDDLGAADFWEMVTTDLKCSDKTGRMLMAIAADERIRKHVSYLPAAYSTIYQIHCLPSPAFERAIKDGTINPEVERQEIVQLKQAVTQPPQRKPASRPEPRDAVFVETAPSPAPSPPAARPGLEDRNADDVAGFAGSPLDPLVEFVQSTSFFAVARETMPGERAKIRNHIVIVRNWLAQLELALTREATTNGVDAGGTQPND